MQVDTASPQRLTIHAEPGQLARLPPSPWRRPVRASEGKPGDVVRDADGNLWCRERDNASYRLVFVFTPTSHTGECVISSGREGRLVVLGSMLRGPLTLLTPPVESRYARLESLSSPAILERLSGCPAPTPAKYFVLRYAAEGWLSVTQPATLPVWRKNGEELEGGEAWAAWDLLHSSMIALSRPKLFAGRTGTVCVTELGRRTLERWQSVASREVG
jgi:hypothetical protein